MFIESFEKIAIQHSTLRQLIRAGVKARADIKPTEKLPRAVMDKMHLAGINYSIKHKAEAKRYINQIRDMFPKKKAG